MHLAIRREYWQMVLMLQLVEGGLARGTLSTPSKGPKGEVAPVLGSQHTAGLPPLAHAQGNARPYRIDVIVTEVGGHGQLSVVTGSSSLTHA